ncbi:MAG TPA: GNAT family N-acetyltransferase [Armatimonadota bacterium]|jgi:ribosomal protein S18 acetylase RimI-like enzyme
MSLIVKKLEEWGPAAAVLAASREMPCVPPRETARLRSWVDAVSDRVHHRELAALICMEGDRPAGLIAYARRGPVVRVGYAHVAGGFEGRLPEMLAGATPFFAPATRVVVDAGPACFSDDPENVAGYAAAGYHRFERARMERLLKATGDDALHQRFHTGPHPDIVALPVNDLPALERLQRAGYAGSPDALLVDDLGNMVTEMLADPWFSAAHSFAVRRDGELHAALYTFLKERTAWIASLCVCPSARGTGLGRHLMLHAMEAFREAGMPRVGLHVTLGNRAAARLYRQVGFRMTGRIGVLYARELTAPE